MVADEATILVLLRLVLFGSFSPGESFAICTWSRSSTPSLLARQLLPGIFPGVFGFAYSCVPFAITGLKTALESYTIQFSYLTSTISIYLGLLARRYHYW
ncbi:hypothetical protein K432DRAFT_146698 [Lepidopterella palustris CBS 459.81]|uniref:Uncharacterized protein n=1 Tax=Lepidopterella palustris CBS 459.81 TaxID=1314670 RepID=A0A8E2JBL9_9PEZI|nr:hypothetical protein K432DRAFT_146698 [Lepidopterella palustris CBS 459.81]